MKKRKQPKGMCSIDVDEARDFREGIEPSKLDEESSNWFYLAKNCGYRVVLVFKE